MANILTSLKNWSITEASNQPDSTDATTLVGDLRAIQAGVRYMRSQDTIASATTCDLGTKDAESLTISGTTTITGLGTVSAGIIKRVVFSGALLLTYNATSLILPSNANITTVAGDTAEFESLGSGNWRCNWYQRDSGHSVGPGSVLQVVQGTKTTDFSTTSATYVDTGLAATITPSSASSKILAIASFWAGADGTGVEAAYAARLFRGATALNTTGAYMGATGDTNVYFDNSCYQNYLDSPATTSATTYSIWLRRAAASGTGAYLFGDDVVATITLMEIAG
jgi:hypothetical protein